jgi:hypothetical protein
MNLEHISTAVRTHRISADDAADECLADQILNHDALRLRAPSSRLPTGQRRRAGTHITARWSRSFWPASPPPDLVRFSTGISLRIHFQFRALGRG